MNLVNQDIICSKLVISYKNVHLDNKVEYLRLYSICRIDNNEDLLISELSILIYLFWKYES